MNGLHAYGVDTEAAQVAVAMLDAAQHFDDRRLPELFGGLERHVGLPVPYLDANAPQAWAAGSVARATCTSVPQPSTSLCAGMRNRVNRAELPGFPPLAMRAKL